MNKKIIVKKNGKATKKEKKVLSTTPPIDVVEKQKIEVELETMMNNIFKYADQMKNALTNGEKVKCLERIKMLEMSRNMLLGKYEKRFETKLSDEYSIPSSSKIIPIEEMFSTKYPGLRYNADDPNVKKEVGYSLSYDSGYSGYTEKEAEELKRLLELE